MTSYKGDCSAVQLWQVHPCPFPLCCKLVRFDTRVTGAQLWSCTCAFACVHLCTLGHESGKPTAHRSMCQTIWCVATFSNNRRRNHGRFRFYYWSQDRPIHNMHCPSRNVCRLNSFCCQNWKPDQQKIEKVIIKVLKRKWRLFSDIQLSLYMFGHWTSLVFLPAYRKIFGLELIWGVV